jgi:pyridoxamine 5'-phosphate oxidase
MSDPIASLRLTYARATLDEGDVAADPITQFRAWFEAARASQLREPNAMTLATATPDGVPSARIVLLKGVDERGFVFFTDYRSRKGAELEANPRAALVFYWRPLGRQVRVEGTVRRLPAVESEAYWATRPPRSRAAAAASRQSEPLESLEELEAESERLLAESGGEVERPGRWGGYLLEPDAIEFWQHRDDRLHDRTRYTRAREGWTGRRLSP